MTNVQNAVHSSSGYVRNSVNGFVRGQLLEVLFLASEGISGTECLRTDKRLDLEFLLPSIVSEFELVGVFGSVPIWSRNIMAE